jgi:hypothetical protein
MQNAPRIWLDYRPVRIGWVIPDRDITRLQLMAAWNSCLWGGRFNPAIPMHDEKRSKDLINTFSVDVLLDVNGNAATRAFIDQYTHLCMKFWGERIFRNKDCEFADIRHTVRRMVSQRRPAEIDSLMLPTWEQSDALRAVFSVLFGCYPAVDKDVADYKHLIRDAVQMPDKPILADGDIPTEILQGITPLGLSGYHITRRRNRGDWLNPAIVLGSASDFDDLAFLWNLRAAGARAIFFDERDAARLNSFANAFLETVRARSLRKPASVNFWSRTEFSKDWKTELDVGAIQPWLRDARTWYGLDVEPDPRQFSIRYHDVLPSYSEAGGEPRASFALPDRPFDDDDVQSLRQKYVVVVDAHQYGPSPDADRSFETPFVPQLNEFYGRNFYFDYDKVRAQPGRLGQGAIGIITEVLTQRLEISAFSVFAWLRAFFSACGVEIERSEAGLRCTRLIGQLGGGLQDCRAFKIRGVRELIQRYGVDEHFTRTAAIEAIRDVDPATGAIGFDAFKRLSIEYREGGELKPPHVLKYLLARRVFRVGLELKCPNCELPSWVHLDDVKTTSSCPYCDQLYDVTPQLADRDWRYRRSGIFGRNDNQLGGIPVALTLQQLSSNVHEHLLMYSTALKFRRLSADIEECETDFVGILSGAVGIGESPVQVLLGEAKTHQSFNADDVRKLGKLADAIPSWLAQAFIMFSKTDSFTPDEVNLARTLNQQQRHRRVILWSRDELEPYYAYERSADRLGSDQHASTLTDMANNTHRLFFT